MATPGFTQKNIEAAFRTLADNNLLPVVNAGAPTDGTAGTAANYAGKGCLLVDTTNGVLYINTGTKASPTWTKVGTQS
jgi:hypothetical protein